METQAAQKRASRIPLPFKLLFRDPLAGAAAVFLIIVTACAIIAPMLIGHLAEAPNFRARNMAPFSLEQGFAYILGADTLGRSLLARLAVGARNTLGIAAIAVMCSLLIGGTLGLIAGYSRGWLGNAIMRATDIVMSFPSLLLALIVLFSLGPSIPNLILVLAITRVPIYLRTTRAEVLEVRERMFVSAATALGASDLRLIFSHIAPMVLPTVLTIGAIDFATVVLAESSLSFLGLGIQAPAFTWGSMVATGRGYLANAWWVAFWPGLAILLTTLSLNILSSWWRTYADPHQRWRLELGKKERK
ncbi:peptide/nickel transport system permease protein [Pelagibacterium luteolum]|uniref:Peptide/nickel transport system permease protein n=2 Tax=Pelagibacterium luteolum TaxID=440168 RepID=A0A1G7S013_9HYPH|nr:ABC transporter permease [Pelagibacterium luteolum]SDG16372.1 peptide/nickel transport system permease protein [Pelagibacterium luteolum]